MRGAIITIRPTASQVVPEDIIDLDRAPILDDLTQAIGGGPLEAVPGFSFMEHDGVRVPCVAFCDEDGKGKRLPLNMPATRLWAKCLNIPVNLMPDHLVGDIAIVFGDREFMEAL